MSLPMALVNSIGASHLMPFRIRTLILKAVGVDMKLRGKVSPGVIIKTNALSIGRRSTINYQCVIDNRARVSIGANVGIGIGVKLITSSHEMGDPAVRAGASIAEPITIDDGAWIGSGAVILPGVTIGKGAVIAAGAIVTKDVPANEVHAGVPAKLLRVLGGAATASV